MKFLLTTTILSVLLIFSVTPYYAHPNANEHNKELESVLFERGYSKHLSKRKEYITAIEEASYLTIDQYGGRGEDTYKSLKKKKMGGLPFKFDTIDYREDLFGNGTKINPNTHRLFTHQGWDIDYGNSKVNKFWKVRKNILLGTVNSVFDFGIFSSITGYSDKCNSIAGIIYYVHILGDYAEADKKDKIQQLAALAGRSDECNMIPALREYFKNLFENQQSSQSYKDLMNGLDDIEDRAASIYRSTGSINTDEKFQEYHECASDLLELLQKHVPGLLKKEEFFKKVFYSDIV